MAKPQIKMGTSITDYHQVKLDGQSLVSPYCTIVGDVKLGPGSSVFAGTQIRGDCEPIRIGSLTNVQENSCLHVSLGSPLTVGDRVTIGHMAMLHGCTIEDEVLIGMGSIVMDDAHIGAQSIVGAGSLVTQGKVFPTRSLILGSPARVVRELSDEEVDAMISVAADAYAEVARSMHAEGLMCRPPADAKLWPCPAPEQD